MVPHRVPKRIANTIIQSLKGGVVPRIGLSYITVGRRQEIDALLHDVEIIEDGGASFRFVVGRYGSGKSFLLQTIRNYVMDKNFVVVDADLTPERRLHGNKGQGLATYRELIRNMSTRTRPEGGALPLILDRWIQSVKAQTAQQMQGQAEGPLFETAVREKIYAVISSMNGLVHGFDFAKLLTLYYEGDQLGDEEKKARVIKWFRGEYERRQDVKSELGINIIITDDDWYEYVKLFAWFLRQAGYSGMMVMIDELVNLYKIPNAIARQYNYEKILTMYNDTLQGKAHYLGIIMAGTPQCIEDQRRGIYSYEALRSRLQQGRFATHGIYDLMGPVIRLKPLSAEEMLVLCGRLSEIHAQLYGYQSRLNDQDLAVFIQIEYSRIGADSHITPREVIRDFIELLDILLQNPQQNVKDLLQSDSFQFSRDELAQQEEDFTAQQDLMAGSTETSAADGLQTSDAGNARVSGGLQQSDTKVSPPQNDTQRNYAEFRI